MKQYKCEHRYEGRGKCPDCQRTAYKVELERLLKSVARVRKKLKELEK